MIASADAIDAAVLDINWQGKPVYPVAEPLQARGVPFLFATGYDPASVPPPHGVVPPARNRSILRWWRGSYSAEAAIAA